MSKKRLTTEEFIECAKKMHGDRYDYSLVEYINVSTKVKIICPIHGVFEQTPNSHLRKSGGSGCLTCSIENQKTNIEDLLNNFNKVHNNKYDYSLIEYKNMKTKVKVICPIHGVFEILPTNHKNGLGCSKCEREERLFSNEEIIEKFNKIHNNLYDYSLVEYQGTDNKVKIICEKHGIFKQTPHSHLQGQGCPICSNSFKHTNKSFIKKSKEIHGHKYDYSLVDYKGNKIKIKIICKKHGIFKQQPNAHLQGQGCPKCSIENRTHDQEYVLSEFKKIHADKYDYSLVKYKNFYTKVKIICEKHGIFEQTPQSHLRGSGCPICNESKGEKEIAKILDDNNIKYIREKRFNDCKDILSLPFDFFLPEKNICIEFDGTQHYYETNCWNDLEYIQKHDQIKNKYCIENNINLLRIKFNCKNIENIVLKYIKSISLID